MIQAQWVAQLLKAEKWDFAIQRLEKLLTEQPNNEVAALCYLYRGMILAESGVVRFNECYPLFAEANRLLDVLVKEGGASPAANSGVASSRFDAANNCGEYLSRLARYRLSNSSLAIGASDTSVFTDTLMAWSMKRVLDKFLYGSALAAVLFCPVFALAEDAKQETAEEATPTISAEFVDPAFDRYIDITLLGLAWEAQNGAALTDAALQLAEGERVLFRNHKTFTSKAVFEKALAVAADQKDKETLERLAKIAKANGDDTFSAKVAQTAKLSAASRTVGSDIEKITDPASEGSLAYVQYLSEMISRIRVTGDKTALDNIEKSVKELNRLTRPSAKEKLTR